MPDRLENRPLIQAISERVKLVSSDLFGISRRFVSFLARHPVESALLGGTVAVSVFGLAFDESFRRFAPAIGIAAVASAAVSVAAAIPIALLDRRR